MEKNGRIKKGLVLKPAESEHFFVGSGKATARFGDTSTLNPTGDWTPFKAADEHQSNAVFDTDCCWIFATLKAWIMLANIQGFNDFPKDLAERFIAVLVDAQSTGGNPWDAGETFRKNGCVLEQALPFTDDITTWDEWKHPNPMEPTFISLAKALLDKFEPGQEWIFAWGSSYTPEQKTQMIADAAKRGTVAYSVDGNYKFKKKQLVKTIGGQDTHWVTHLRSNDDGTKVFHDQYEPFQQTVAKDYDHNAAILYFLKKKEPKQQTFWDTVLTILANHFKNVWNTLKQ